MGMSREDVYIANVMKSRPPDNRTPLPTEVERCAPYLAAQLQIIRPEVIVSLGGPATKFLLGVDTGITKLRGQWADWCPPGAALADRIAVMPTYHPAYLLRNYTPKTRGEVWSDLKQVMERLQQGS
jgi:DNA polymerase